MENKKKYAGVFNQFSESSTSKIVLIPVLFEETDSSLKYTDKGAKAFLEASEKIELYDIETDSEVYRHGIYLSDKFSWNSSIEEMVNAVHDLTKKHIQKNKFVTLFGDERAISIGSIRAFNECYDNLTVLQIDAHANLCPEFQGSVFNSSCSAYEASQTTNLIQVGIRSMNAIEKTIIDEEKVFFAHDMATNEYWIDEVVDLCSENIFITFDLDALDPSIFPATNTPEPGGLFWYETLAFLQKIFSEKNVVGCDMMGLHPNEQFKNSDVLAAKLYYKMLSYKFNNIDENDVYLDDSENDSKKVSKLKYNIEGDEY